MQEAVLKTPEVVQKFMGKLVVFHGWQEGLLALAALWPALRLLRPRPATADGGSGKA